MGVGGRGPESEDGFRRYCRRGRDPRAVAGGGRRTSFLGGRDRQGREGGGREARGARFFVIGFDWRRRRSVPIVVIVVVRGAVATIIVRSIVRHAMYGSCRDSTFGS